MQYNSILAEQKPAPYTGNEDTYGGLFWEATICESLPNLWIISLLYTDTPHNYRVYLPTNYRTVVRRDLKFDEQKAMRVSLERELKLHAEEELSIPKEEKPKIDAEQPHAEDPGVETSTHAEASRDWRKRSRESNRLMLYVWENVG